MTIIKTILGITIQHHTPQEAATDLVFNVKQNEQLEHLSD